MVVAEMPRKKLSRKAKKSRVTMYEKSRKEDSPSPDPGPVPMPHSHSEPTASSPGPSTTTSDSIEMSPVVGAMVTSSPSVHDLTVTYDYSTDHAPPISNPPSTDRFLALFPFTESPTSHRQSADRGARLWTDLSPPVIVKHHKPQKDNSSEIHQLNVIARKLRETLAEHHSTTQESMTFDPLSAHLDFSEGEDDDCDGSNHGDDHDHDNDSNHGDMRDVGDPEDQGGGYKESEDDWFWSQVALQVDTSTPSNTTGHRSTLSHAKQPTAHTGTISTLPHTKQPISYTKKPTSSKRSYPKQLAYTGSTRSHINQPTAHSSTSSTQSHTKQLTSHTVTSSTQSHIKSQTSFTHTTSTSTHLDRGLRKWPHPHTAVSEGVDEWGVSHDDEFVDHLLIQGVGLGPPTTCPGRPIRQESGANRPLVTNRMSSRQKCSQEEIERKRVLAKQRLQARHSKH